YAQDMETQIAAEARGVTRKNIPWDTFHSTYLCDFSIKAQSKLTQGSQQAKTHAYEMYAIWELHACEMAYGRGTHMRGTRMRAPVRGTPMRSPMRDACLWDSFCEKHVYK